MASAVVNKYVTSIMQGLLSGTIKVVLVDTGQYTYSASHEFLSDVPAGARVAISPALASKTVTDGAFGAANVTITGVTGATVEGFYVFDDSGSAATSRLIRWCDDATGLVYTPNGGDVTIVWQSGTVFSL